jgi:hypothetical protein
MRRMRTIMLRVSTTGMAIAVGLIPQQHLAGGGAQAMAAQAAANGRALAHNHQALLEYAASLKCAAEGFRNQAKAAQDSNSKLADYQRQQAKVADATRGFIDVMGRIPTVTEVNIEMNLSKITTVSQRQDHGHAGQRACGGRSNAAGATSCRPS